MANKTNTTVTISADYFVKLHRMATNEELSVATINSLAKERDELKAERAAAERAAAERERELQKLIGRKGREDT